MSSEGLRQVSNPSEIFLSNTDEKISGVTIASYLEGNRPLMIEIQSLVGRSSYPTPQRSTTGFDLKRLNMLLAVLEKRAGYTFASKDVFLNVAGGLKINDPSTDLAVCVSLAASLSEKFVPMDACFAAEVGLGGEIRPISKISQRITEAKKLGFKNIFVSKLNFKDYNFNFKPLNIYPCKNIIEVFNALGL